jgi:hypothetical protein
MLQRAWLLRQPSGEPPVRAARNETISNPCHWHAFLPSPSWSAIRMAAWRLTRETKEILYCLHAIIASGRVRLSSDGGAKIAR